MGATGACATRGRRTRPSPTLSFPHAELNGGGSGISLCRVRRCEGGWLVNGTSCVPSVCPGRGCSRGSSARAPNRARGGCRGVRQTMDSDAAVAACRRLFLGFPIARRLPAPSASVRPAQRPAPRPTGPALHSEGDSGAKPSTRARLGESSKQKFQSRWRETVWWPRSFRYVDENPGLKWLLCACVITLSPKPSQPPWASCGVRVRVWACWT